MIKHFTYAWEKGRRSIKCKRGTKVASAFDLILNRHIAISKKDVEKLDLRNKSFKELVKITSLEASKLLESKGWVWKKV